MTKRRLRVLFDLILLLVQKDLRVRYRGSILGYVWSMLNPLLYMAVLSVVFSYVLKFKIDNYPVFILTGIITWNLFHQSLMQGVNSIVANGGLIRKVKVSVSLFPSATVASVLVHFLLSLVAFLLICIFTKFSPQLSWFFLPIVLIPFVLFVWGVTLAFASLNVFFRDVGHLLDPALQLLFYGTPVIYPLSVLPEKFAFIVKLNPLTHFVSSFRDVLYRGVIPSLSQIGILCLLAGVSMVVGVCIYRSLRGRFVYQV